MERYHLRSNVESTFSSMKRLFGSSLRSRTETAMRNEVLCTIPSGRTRRQAKKYLTSKVPLAPQK